MARVDGKLVFLRTLARDDSEEILAMRLRNREFFEPYEPIVTDEDFTLGSVRAVLAAHGVEEKDGRGYSFGIFDSSDGALAGRIRVTNVFRGPWLNANLGYYIDEERNGRGLATEAVRLATTYALHELKLHRVQAAVMTDNERSMRVLEKNGFRREGLALRYLNINGEWRDHIIFAVTVEEWPP